MDETFRKFEQGLDSWAAEMKLIIPTAFNNVKKDNFLGQTSNELQKEIAAVKDMLSDIVVSIQSANDKITQISEVIATNSLHNCNNNSKINNNSNNVKNNSCFSKNSGKSSSSSDKSSREGESSGEGGISGESESSEESDGSSDEVSSGNSERRRRRRRKMGRKNDFDRNASNFISSNARNYHSTDNSNKQTNKQKKQTN